MRQEIEALKQQAKEIQAKLRAYKQAKRLLAPDRASELLVLLVLSHAGIPEAKEALKRFAPVLDIALLQKAMEEAKSQKQKSILEACLHMLKLLQEQEQEKEKKPAGAGFSFTQKGSASSGLLKGGSSSTSAM